MKTSDILLIISLILWFGYGMVILYLMDLTDNVIIPLVWVNTTIAMLILMLVLDFKRDEEIEILKQKLKGGNKNAINKKNKGN